MTQVGEVDLVHARRTHLATQRGVGGRAGAVQPGRGWSSRASSNILEAHGHSFTLCIRPRSTLALVVVLQPQSTPLFSSTLSTPKQPQELSSPTGSLSEDEILVLSVLHTIADGPLLTERTQRSYILRASPSIRQMFGQKKANRQVYMLSFFDKGSFTNLR